MKRIGGGWSVAGAALTGADEEVGEDWVVLDEFKGETAEVIARGSREVSCSGDDWACVHGDVLTAWAWRDGVADVAGVHGGAESRVVGKGVGLGDQAKGAAGGAGGTELTPTMFRWVESSRSFSLRRTAAVSAAFLP